ncbi:unnamed protein product [Polarella glacialis]|uniref:SET domain-containing protein n=1 Tax=Polarella glacialis TaxID=89957 RepID=A0A813GT44_POLGL|nr:unnamed protein product [Polarella glacialis]
MEERGVVATRDLSAGEVLMDLPLTVCMAAASGSEDILGPAAAALDSAGIEPVDAALTVAFAQETALREASPWWPYLSLVGEARRGFPCFFAQEELAALQSPPLVELLESIVPAFEAVATIWGLERDDLLAAWELVHSRRFGCKDGRFMLPVGDLMNHSFEPSCAWEEPTADRASWRLVSLRQLAAGDPLTFCYCKDPNHLLLLNSGFIVPGNPNNRVMIRPADLRRCMSAAASSPCPEDFASWRAQQFEEQLPDPGGEGPGMSMFLVGRVPSGGIQWNPLWLDLCGMATSSGGARPHWSKLPGGTEQFCATLEKATWALFPTSLEADLSEIASANKQPGAMSANSALALEFRIEQKQLLADALGSLRQKLLSQK